MRTSGYITTCALTVAAITVVSAHPALANPVESPVTLAVVAGALTISAPASLMDLGSSANRSGEAISGQLGEVRVTDSRGAGPGGGWVASVVSTDFATSDGSAIPATAISYSAGAVTSTGTGTYTEHDSADLSVLRPAVTATDVEGENAAIWRPSISISVPPNAIAGVYNATITHSVA